MRSIGFWYCSTTKEVKSGATSYPACLTYILASGVNSIESVQVSMSGGES